MKDQAHYLREMMKNKRKQVEYRAVWGGDSLPSLAGIGKLKEGCITVGEKGMVPILYTWANGNEEEKTRFIETLEEAERRGNVLLQMKGSGAIALNLFRLSNERFCVVRPTLSSLEETASWIRLSQCLDVSIIVVIPREIEEPHGLGEAVVKFIAERSGQEVYWLGSVWEDNEEEIVWNEAYPKRKQKKVENEDNRTPLVKTVRHHLLSR